MSDINKNAIPLRPHHGLCLAFFEGKGYSTGFTAHMQHVLNMLCDDSEIAGSCSEIPVILTVDTDVVCSACPNNHDGICDSDIRVKSFDNKVLSLCHLSDGQIISFGKFTSMVQENIISLQLRSHVCSGCQWEDICEGHISRWAI